MTPYKEKAKQLVFKFFDELESISDKWIRLIEAKACALIAVEEIIQSWKDMFGQDENTQPDIIYWQKVKIEIGKL